VLRLLYRQLTFDPLRTVLTTTALASVVAVVLNADVQDSFLAGFRSDSFISLRLSRFL